MGQLFTIAILVLTGVIFFLVYFIFKSLQFVVQAVNLYKDMISRQDMMIKQLNEIVSLLRGSKDAISQSSESAASLSEPLNETEKKIISICIKLRKERPDLSEIGTILKIKEEAHYSEDLIKDTLKKVKDLKKEQSVKKPPIIYQTPSDDMIEAPDRNHIWSDNHKTHNIEKKCWKCGDVYHGAEFEGCQHCNISLKSYKK